MGSRSKLYCSTSRPWAVHYRREEGWARKLTRKLERRRAQRLIDSGRHDLADTRQTKGTQGWMTH